MRPYSAPFFFNIKFYQPSEINQSKNSAHIRYIGTRSGVDLGHEIDTRMEVEPDTPEHHVKYAHERPRSHGLFGAGNEEINMLDVQKELQEHKGMVWRIIVSLHGDDAKRLDMEDRESWEEVIKQQLPRAAADMGISETNLNWVAAFHAEVGHPHAHIVLWEKKPKRRMGKVTPYVKSQMRKKFIQKIYSADRDRYGKEKTAMRDMIRQRGITTLREAVNFAREWRTQMDEVNRLFALTGRVPENRLTAKPDIEQINKLVKGLEEISSILPNKGRIMLKFMPEDVKQEVRKLAEWLYQEPQFAPLRAKYEEASEILARPYTQQQNQLKEAVDRAREDIINRISQIVLKAATEINKVNHFAIQPDIASEVVRKFNDATGYVPDDLSERLKKEVLKKLVKSGVPIDMTLKIIETANLEIPNSIVAAAYLYEPKTPVFQAGVPYLIKAAYGEEIAEEYMNKQGYQKGWIDKMKSYKNVPLDLSSLARVLKVGDKQLAVVEKMAKTLISCGLTIEEAKQVMSNWSSRSGSNVSVAKLDKVLGLAKKEIEDAKDWGRTPFISKKEFYRLCNSLQVTVKFPWRTSREQQSVMKGHTKSVATSVFKSALHSISASIRRANAENEYAQIKAMDRIKEKTEREQEERERGEQGRGR